MSRNRGLGIAALLTGIVALVISVSAYNRSGQDIDDSVGESAEQSAQSIGELSEDVASGVVETAEEVGETAETTAMRATAASRLAAIRAEVEAKQNWQKASQEVANIRSGIADAYRDEVEGEMVAEARELDQQLATIEAELRQESAEALESIGDLIERLELNIRSDEENGTVD